MQGFRVPLEQHFPDSSGWLSFTRVQVLPERRPQGDEPMAAGVYGNLIRVDTDNGAVEEMLERVPLYAGVGRGGVSEDTLQGPPVPFPTSATHRRHRCHLR